MKVLSLKSGRVELQEVPEDFARELFKARETAGISFLKEMRELIAGLYQIPTSLLFGAPASSMGHTLDFDKDPRPDRASMITKHCKRCKNKVLFIKIKTLALVKIYKCSKCGYKIGIKRRKRA